MTSEVVVMNKLAVALAADSAATVASGDSRKIWNSANKLFALSKCHPVGVMVYNASSILGVPWETIIKEYRVFLERRSFPTIEQYCQDFLTYLANQVALFSPALQERYARRAVSAGLHRLKRRHEDDIYHRVVDLKEDEPDRLQLLRDLVHQSLEETKKRDVLISLGDHAADEIRRRLRPAFEAEIAAVFAEDIDAALAGDLFELAVESFARDDFSEAYSGLVFAGFGDDEHFPAIANVEIDGMVIDRLRHKPIETSKISEDNLAQVKPFAQREMVNTFLYGVNPAVGDFFVNAFVGLALALPDTIIDAIADLTPEQKQANKAAASPHVDRLVNEWMGRIDERLRQHNQPILQALVQLPKDELAHVAEALVNLNSFQKRVSLDDETVGGPIDVAVISKGDGLIWIKRKHYFQPELNRHYFDNMMRQLR